MYRVNRGHERVHRDVNVEVSLCVTGKPRERSSRGLPSHKSETETFSIPSEPSSAPCSPSIITSGKGIAMLSSIGYYQLKNKILKIVRGRM